MTDDRADAARQALGRHEILRREDGASLLWVDRHLVHEGSHHAFAKIAERGLPVAEPGLTFGVVDHYAPTRAARARPAIARMIDTLERNTAPTASPVSGWTTRGRASST
jgi:homoaconitase/3-isopropylmalate dehydratase large subunit